MEIAQAFKFNGHSYLIAEEKFGFDYRTFATYCSKFLKIEMGNNANTNGTTVSKLTMSIPK